MINISYTDTQAAIADAVESQSWAALDMPDYSVWHGKGYWIWKVRYCERGDVGKIAFTAIDAGYNHVTVKIADGIGPYNIHPDTGEDLAVSLTQALQEVGIRVLGWQYIYGANPEVEARKAVQRIQETGVDGFIIDAEKEYKGRPDLAERYILELRGALERSALGDFPLALSSYRFPELHRDFPFDTFLRYCDIAMPQVYWEGSHNPGVQLYQCVEQYNQLKYIRPIVPAGAAYKRGDWEATPLDVTQFLEVAEGLELMGANFWEWAHTRKHLPDTWSAIANYQWAGYVPDPPEPPDNGDEPTMNELENFIELMQGNGIPITANIEYLTAGGVIDPDPGNGNGNGDEPPPPPPPEPPPQPGSVSDVNIKVDKCHAMMAVEYNAAGKPVMSSFPKKTDNAARDRIFYYNGDKAKVYREPITADGAAKYYLLWDKDPIMVSQLDGREIPEDGLYLLRDHVSKTW